MPLEKRRTQCRRMPQVGDKPLHNLRSKVSHKESHKDTKVFAFVLVWLPYLPPRRPTAKRTHCSLFNLHLSSVGQKVVDYTPFKPREAQPMKLTAIRFVLAILAVFALMAVGAN